MPHNPKLIRNLTRSVGTGVDFGDHGYAPGMGEEIEIKRTLWERLIDFLFPDPWAAEYRALLLQEARRLKMENDEVQRRAAKEREAAELEEEKRKHLPVMGTCRIAGWVYDGKAAVCVIELRERDGNRRADFASLRANGYEIVGESREDAIKYIKSRAEWCTTINPWVEGVTSTETMFARAAAAEYDLIPVGEMLEKPGKPGKPGKFTPSTLVHKTHNYCYDQHITTPTENVQETRPDNVVEKLS